MNTFTIDPNNNITPFASLKEAEAAQINDAEYFGSQQELTKLAGSWPATRPVEVWNSFAGVAPFDKLKPVKKFATRKAAVARIWQTLRLLATVGEPARDVATRKARGKKAPAKGKRRDVSRRVAKGGKNVAREGSKKSEVVAMIRRAKGATLGAIMQATGWQATRCAASSVGR